MFHSKIRRVLSATLIASAIATSAAAETYGNQAYQIVKATDSRVWRLNTHTGEIAVCSLEGEQLLCTSSDQAARPPKKTYADLEAERAQAEREQALAKEEKRKRSLAMLNLMMNAFRDLAVSGSRLEHAQ